VDEGVANIVGALERTGALQNTYIVFTSDNGYLQGEHRVPSGKLLPHDPASRVPLIVRGPGLPTAATSRELVGNVDLAPTVHTRNRWPAGRELQGHAYRPLALRRI
jgi:N-acetylglucosamine-6-sulfatase